MNLQTLSSHTIDIDRVPEAPVVLDAGARDWGFTRDMLKLRPQAWVLAMDPAPDIMPPLQFGREYCDYIRMALVGDDRGGSGFMHGGDGHGDFVTDENADSVLRRHPGAEVIRVPCVNITWLMRARRIEHWDVVKLDVEGSEFQILEMWPGPIATQISVEFHDYNQRSKYSDAYYETLFAKLATFGYRVVQHEVSDISGRGAWGHWDSLLVLEG